MINFKDSRGNIKLKPYEHVLDLYSIGQYIGRSGDNIGSIILRRGNSFIVRFGWRFQVHADIGIEESVTVIESLRQLCKEMPERESMKIEWSCFPNYEARDKELQQLYNQSTPEIKALITSERQKLLELSSTNNKKGIRIRKPTDLVIWCSYSMQHEDLELDWVEKFLLFSSNKIKKWSGEQQADQRQKYENFLQAAYKNGYQTWARLLETRLPAQITQMPPTDSWQQCWLPQNRFSNTQVSELPPIPHLTVINTFDKTVKEELNGRHDIRSLLSFGNNAMPIASRDSVYLGKKHITVLALTDEPADKPEGYFEAEQMNFLGELTHSLWDTEIVVEITKPNQKKARKNIQETRDDAVARAAQVAKDGGVSVVSEDDAEDLVDAERQMMRDGAIVQAGVVIKVHRDTRVDSRFAAEQISNYFQLPAKCSIEDEVAYPFWLHSLPYCATPLLSNLFSRQLKTSSDWVPTYMPIWTSVAKGSKGVELPALYGGNPVYFDLEYRRGHFIILGYTGCGKSVFAGQTCTFALASGRDVTIVDTPTSKEASTFKSYAAMVNGSYIDILDPETCYNFFQTPDVDPEDPDREEYLQDFHSSVLNILEAMVLGDPSANFDGVIASRYKTILVRALREFFNSTEIQLRYESAKNAGMGTPEWEEIPTLKTFLSYLTPNRLQLQTLAEQEALTSVYGALEKWVDGKFGKALSQPSRVSIRDKKLVVLALRDISSPQDAVVWSAVTDSILTTRAILSRKNGSLAFIDEANIKFKYAAFAQSFADLCAIARKANMIVGAAAQSPGILDPQNNDKIGQQILANLRYKFIGYIVPGLAASYARVVSLPIEMLDPPCSPQFAPNYKDGKTNWLMLDESHVNYVSYYVSDLLAKILSNEEHQRAARDSLIIGLTPREALEKLYNSTKTPTHHEN
jgi:hypothetical protein